MQLLLSKRLHQVFRHSQGFLSFHKRTKKEFILLQPTAHCAARLRPRPTLACLLRAGGKKLYQPLRNQPKVRIAAAVVRHVGSDE